jgi:nucleoside-diphosphate-sugar epimerase
VRDLERAADLATLGVQLCLGDITQRETLPDAMRGADGVFHVAGWYKVGVPDKSPAEPVNVQGTRNVLETMRDLGIPRGVYTSTLAVFSDTHGHVVNEDYYYDGPHLSEYDRTKWLAHYAVAKPMMAQGLPLTIVQPGAVYGPGDTSQLGETIREHLEQRQPFVPKETGYCWSHVDDTVQGHLLAMEEGEPGRSYIIAGPPHTLVEAFQMIEDLTGQKAPPLEVPPGGIRALASLAGVIERVVPLPPQYTAEALRTLAGVTYWASNARARKELGYRPRPLKEGLRETLLAIDAPVGG